jgi:uncharacterized protein (DUF3084 family)
LSWQSPVALFLLLALGGVIAYFADRLGRVLGKKRLSLFGLRPRHTAEMLTVFAGVMIPLVTIIIVLAVSKGVRDWALHSADVLRERDKAINDLTESRTELGNVQHNLQGDQQKLNKANSELDKAKKSLSSLQLREQSLIQQVQSEATKVKAAETQYQSVRAQFANVRLQLSSAQTNYKAAKTNYVSLKGQMDQLKGSFSKLNLDLGRLQTNYTTLNVQKNEADHEVTLDLAKLGEVNSQLKLKQTELDNKQASIDRVNADLAQAESELQRVSQQVAELNFVYQREKIFGNEGRIRPVIFQLGDELARMQIPTGLSAADARTYVQRVVDMASVVAKGRGATKGKQLPTEAGIIELLTADNTKITKDAQELRYTLAMTGRTVPGVVIASAYWNSLAGEFVPLVLDVRDNPIIFHKDERIAETTVEGALSDDKIYEEISHFVQNNVKQRARQDKMIPVVGREESFGQVLPGDILNIVKQIHDWGPRSVRLTAYAAQDTRAADPLELKFRIR